MKNVETISLDLSESKEIWFMGVVFAEMKKRFAKMKKGCSKSTIMIIIVL